MTSKCGPSTGSWSRRRGRNGDAGPLPGDLGRVRAPYALGGPRAGKAARRTARRLVRGRGRRPAWLPDGRAGGAVLGSLPSSPFAALLVTLVKLEGGSHLEVSTSSRELYPYFFAFALSVADAVQLDGINPETALNRSLRDWHALFAQVALLSPERQLLSVSLVDH